MGWGIVYPPYSVINMGAVQPPTPTMRWVYNFNGVNSYIDANIHYSIGDVFTATYEASDNPSSVLTVVDTAVGNKVRLQNNTLDVSGFTVKINGVDYVQAQALPTSGTVNIEFTATTSGTITRLLSSSASVSSLFKGAFYDFKLNGGSIYNYPINDRTFGVGAPIANSATVLGGELWNYAASEVSGLVSKIGNDSYHYNITSAEGAVVRMLDAVTPSETDRYLVELEVYDYVAGGVAWNSGEYVNLGINKNGNYKFLLKAKIADLNLSRVGSVCNLKLRNIRIKQANGYATGINLLESGWTEIPL